MLPEKEVVSKKKEKHYQININKFKWLALRNTSLYICCICGAIMKSVGGLIQPSVHSLETPGLEYD